MKKTIAVAVTGLLFLSTGLAVVGHNGSDGDMSITSSGSASATTAVGPKSTMYNAETATAGKSQNETGNRISNIEVTNGTVRFNGTIEAKTPCHDIDHEISEIDGGYVMNVQTVNSDENSICAQVITGINYEAKFNSDHDYKLEIHHNGEKIEVVKVDYKYEAVHRPKSIVQRILGFFGF